MQHCSQLSELDLSTGCHCDEETRAVHFPEFTADDVDAMSRSQLQAAAKAQKCCKGNIKTSLMKAALKKIAGEVRSPNRASL